MNSMLNIKRFMLLQCLVGYCAGIYAMQESQAQSDMPIQKEDSVVRSEWCLNRAYMIAVLHYAYACVLNARIKVFGSDVDVARVWGRIYRHVGEAVSNITYDGTTTYCWQKDYRDVRHNNFLKLFAWEHQVLKAFQAKRDEKTDGDVLIPPLSLGALEFIHAMKVPVGEVSSSDRDFNQVIDPAHIREERRADALGCRPYRRGHICVIS